MNSLGNKKLLAVPAVVAVIGLVLLIIGLLSGSSVKLTQFSNGSTLSMNGGFSVYSKTAADRTATFCKVDGTTLSVKLRDGQNATVKLAEPPRISAMVKASLGEIKEGSFIGVSAMPQPDGT